MFKKEKEIIKNGFSQNLLKTYNIKEVFFKKNDKRDINEKLAKQSGYFTSNVNEMEKVKIIYLEKFFNDEIYKKEKFLENFIINDVIKIDSTKLKIELTVNGREITVFEINGILTTEETNFNVMDQLFCMLSEDKQIEFSEMYYLETVKDSGVGKVEHIFKKKIENIYIKNSRNRFLENINFSYLGKKNRKDNKINFYLNDKGNNIKSELYIYESNLEKNIEKSGQIMSFKDLKDYSEIYRFNTKEKFENIIKSPFSNKFENEFPRNESLMMIAFVMELLAEAHMKTNEYQIKKVFKVNKIKI
jgi:hypothetical protein